MLHSMFFSKSTPPRNFGVGAKFQIPGSKIKANRPLRHLSLSKASNPIIRHPKIQRKSNFLLLHHSFNKHGATSQNHTR
jgi:hypothetical protein